MSSSELISRLMTEEPLREIMERAKLNPLFWEEYQKITSEELTLQDAEINRLKEENAHFAWRDADKNKLITELALGIDAVQLDTCTQEDWDALNKCANKALEATKYE